MAGTTTLPLIPIREKVVFPHAMIPFDVGRQASVAAIQYAIREESQIALVTQRDKRDEAPGPTDLYEVGCAAAIIQHVALKNGHIRILIEGRSRVRVAKIKHGEFCEAELVMLDDEPPPDARIKAVMGALAKRAAALFSHYAKLHPTPPNEAGTARVDLSGADRIADAIAMQLSVPVQARQEILEAVDPVDRLELVLSTLGMEIEKLRIDQAIAARVKKQMDKAQREYYLNEKIKAIHTELGRKDEHATDMESLRKTIEKAKLTKQVKERALEELRRLSSMPPVSAESTVSRTYIQWLLDLPWAKRSKITRNFRKAEKILMADHYGLDKVKGRILEYLAVSRLVKKPKGAILCFVGPPGVGKTSLGESIARATGRPYVRLSLGGVRDEAEIRGHRRTYIGSFPGQIMQLMKRAGSRNPVFVLDEVDKMGADFRGDPNAALLEVLDPEQNHAFVDHYIDLPFDLSEVMFIATANVIHPVSPALRDRLEVIEIPSYTHLEKLAIARRFLLPKALKAHGLSQEDLLLSDATLESLERDYTREAGVRNLEREIQSLCRKTALKLCRKGENGETEVSPGDLPPLLGPPRFQPERPAAEAVGVATGLAWTQTGGQLLPVECSIMEGRGKLILTGKMGEVMQESARAACSLARCRATRLGLDPAFQGRVDIHIHLPEGAIPKDGPSAGITLAAALVSRLTQQPVRPSLAMTGEISLLGSVLRVGGIREKLLAAYRSGIREVILPRSNEPDLQDVPEAVLDRLTLHFIEAIDDALPLLLCQETVEVQGPSLLAKASAPLPPALADLDPPATSRDLDAPPPP